MKKIMILLGLVAVSSVLQASHEAEPSPEVVAAQARCESFARAFRGERVFRFSDDTVGSFREGDREARLLEGGSAIAQIAATCPAGLTNYIVGPLEDVIIGDAVELVRGDNYEVRGMAIALVTAILNAGRADIFAITADSSFLKNLNVVAGDHISNPVTPYEHFRVSARELHTALSAQAPSAVAPGDAGGGFGSAAS